MYPFIRDTFLVFRTDVHPARGAIAPVFAFDYLILHASVWIVVRTARTTLTQIFYLDLKSSRSVRSFLMSGPMGKFPLAGPTRSWSPSINCLGLAFAILLYFVHDTSAVRGVVARATNLPGHPGRICGSQ